MNSHELISLLNFLSDCWFIGEFVTRARTLSPHGWKQMYRILLSSASYCFNLFLQFSFASILNKNRWWVIFLLCSNVMTWFYGFSNAVAVCLCPVSRVASTHLFIWAEQTNYTVCRMVFFPPSFAHYLCLWLSRKKEHVDLWIVDWINKYSF